MALRHVIFGPSISPLLSLGLNVVQGFFEGNHSNFFETYKNNLLSLNLFIYLFIVFFSFFLKSSKNQV